MLHVTRRITINNEIPQIWDYFNGDIACLPDTVNQQQLKSCYEVTGQWGQQDIHQRKEATYHNGKNSRRVPFAKLFNCIILLEALD